VVTYLEMTAPPARPPAAAPAPGVEVRRAVAPTTSFYRYLYDTVGGPWTWIERRHLADATLAAIIRDPAVEVHVLWVEGVPAGYVELDGRRPPDLEIAYFGLVPEFLGRGLGRFLVDWAVDHAWRTRPARLWVHTCDVDRPRALPLYQKAGFRIYQTRSETVTLPPAS
jgi:GNAT superfamily N-acetyltransferase